MAATTGCASTCRRPRMTGYRSTDGSAGIFVTLIGAAAAYDSLLAERQTIED